MRMVRLLILAALITVPVALSARAADLVPEDGLTCFCLQHRSSQQLLHGCKGIRPPANLYVTARCQGSAPLSVSGEWSAVAEGQGQCVPCDAQPRPTYDPVRKENP